MTRRRATFTATLRRVRLLVLDVDGVLTDGRLYYGARGEALKVFHVRDGHGIKAVAEAGIKVAIISGRKSLTVARRARELGIRHVSQGVSDKLAALDATREGARRRRSPSAPASATTRRTCRCAAAGLGFAVADAHDDARAAADSSPAAGWPRRGARGLRLAARRASAAP